MGMGVSPKFCPEQLGCTPAFGGRLVDAALMERGVPPLGGMQPLFLLSILFLIPGKSLLVPFGLELDPLALLPWCVGLGGLGTPRSRR